MLGTERNKGNFKNLNRSTFLWVFGGLLLVPSTLSHQTGKRSCWSSEMGGSSWRLWFIVSSSSGAIRQRGACETKKSHLQKTWDALGNKPGLYWENRQHGSKQFVTGKNLNFLLLNISCSNASGSAVGFQHLKSATIRCNTFLRKAALGANWWCTSLYLRANSSNGDDVKPFPSLVQRRASQEKKKEPHR